MTTATQERVSFYTHRHDLRLTIEPERFAKVDTRGQIMVDGNPPKAIEFHQGHIETDDPEEIEFLRNHRLCGNPYQGFEEIEKPKPPADANSISAISKLTREGDVNGLEALIAEEEAGHNRPEIIEAAREQLAVLKAEAE